MVDLNKVVNNLIGLSEKKYMLLDELFLLTQKQTLAIEEEDMDELNLIIDKKQCKLDIIKQLDIQFETIVNDLKILYDVKNLDELEIHCPTFSLLKDTISKVMDRVREIISIEKDNKRKLSIAKDQLEYKINQASKGKRAIQQYGNTSGYSDAYFIDKKIK